MRTTSLSRSPSSSATSRGNVTTRDPPVLRVLTYAVAFSDIDGTTKYHLEFHAFVPRGSSRRMSDALFASLKNLALCAHGQGDVRLRVEVPEGGEHSDGRDGVRVPGRGPELPQHVVRLARVRRSEVPVQGPRHDQRRRGLLVHAHRGRRPAAGWRRGGQDPDEDLGHADRRGRLRQPARGRRLRRSYDGARWRQHRDPEGVGTPSIPFSPRPHPSFEERAAEGVSPRKPSRATGVGFSGAAAGRAAPTPRMWAGRAGTGGRAPRGSSPPRSSGSPPPPRTQCTLAARGTCA